LTVAPADRTGARPSGDRQTVFVESGVGYGVVGADLHVFGDGVPLYLLANWRQAHEPDPGWLREMPSRMLNARFAIVGFTGRTAELGELHRWRDGGARLAVRWLHGPAGQGKTRLAARFADESRAEGWKVAIAVHGPGTVLPSDWQEDLRVDGAVGVLLIVDYADRWPLTHLAWLFSNALLHRPGTPARILLLARTADSWPAVRAALADHQADTTGQLLAPLPEESRSAMFDAARDGFAARYELEEPSVVEPPGPLDQVDFGLTLAVHMAALVAVDARANPGSGTRPLADLAGLTCYLLDREHLHWTRRYGNRTHQLGDAASHYRTPPEAMNRTVFTAALTGTVPPSTGAVVLARLGLSLPTDQVLRDHAICYPPADGTVLEPLYPDRLAEDFLALTVPGHTADYPAQPWASDTATAVLDHTIDPARAIIFLASAAARWPHLGPACLFPLLRRHPRLAVDAGGGALSAVAAIPELDIGVLEAIEPLLPLESHVDLDAGVADLTERLTTFRLATAEDDGDRAGLWQILGQRFDVAGRHLEALDAVRRGVELCERLAAADPRRYDPVLAGALETLIRPLSRLGRRHDAVLTSQRVVTIWRRLADADPRFTAELAGALSDLSIGLAGKGEREQALAAAEESVAWYRAVRDSDPADVAFALDTLGNRLADVGRFDDALSSCRQAVALTEKLAATNPAAHRPDLARRLGNLHLRHINTGHWNEATVIAQRVVALWRDLAGTNPAAFEPELAKGLNHLGICLRQLGRLAEAVVATTESVEILRRLAAGNPTAHEPELAAALDHLGDQLARSDRPDDALAAGRESVDTYRRVAETNPGRHRVDLAMALDNLGIRLAAAHQPEPALNACRQAVDIFEQLAAENPDVFRAALARALFNLAFRFVAVGRDADALAVSTRSVELRRALVRINRASYEPDLARSLLGLAVVCLETGAADRLAEARRAIDESVARYRNLADAQPLVFQDLLAQSIYIGQVIRQTPS